MTGEVYEVSEKMLAALDELEGHPRWYRRALAPICLDNGIEIRAWTYFALEPRGQLIPSGDYSDWMPPEEKTRKK